jgi:hypothetical protein
MTPGDTARVLGACALYDNRTVGVADAAAWHKVIGDLDAADAIEAVTRHYAESTERIMPAHVRRLAAEIRRERHRLEREARERLAIEAESSVGRGPLTDRRAEIQAFVGQMREVLPEGDREALAPRTVQWEREHRAYVHQQEGEPNPAFDPALAKPVGEWNRATREPAGAWWEDEAARERHAKTLLAEAGRLRPVEEPEP